MMHVVHTGQLYFDHLITFPAKPIMSYLWPSEADVLIKSEIPSGLWNQEVQKCFQKCKFSTMQIIIPKPSGKSSLTEKISPNAFLSDKKAFNTKFFWAEDRLLDT